jgi:hypothetical protein
MRNFIDIFFRMPKRRTRFHDGEDIFVGISKCFFYFFSFIIMLQNKLKFEKKLPQINFSSLHIFNKIIKNKKIKVLEFGAGYSTIWWAKKNISEIISIESDHFWFEKIYKKIKHLKLDDKAKIIKTNHYTDNKKFDLIIIDGGDRLNHLKSSLLNNINADTIIYYDNTDRINHGNDRKISIEFFKEWYHKNNLRSFTARNFTPYGLYVTAGIFVFPSSKHYQDIIKKN